MIIQQRNGPGREPRARHRRPSGRSLSTDIVAHGPCSVKDQNSPHPVLVDILERYWKASMAGDDARAQELARTYRTVYGRLHREPPRQALPPAMPDKETWAAYMEQRRQSYFDRCLAELLREVEGAHV